MHSGHKGLNEVEAKHLLAKFGPNLLPEKKPPGNIRIVFSQLKSPLVYVLLVAFGVTLYLGEYVDSFVILLAVLVNTVLGFFQERKASNALYALRKLITSQANIIRDGKLIVLETAGIVPGDLVVVGQGDKIPADGKLIETNRFFVEEAVLTGESLPVAKEVGDTVSMGTVVSGGRAIFEVSATGVNTAVGNIATNIQEDFGDTPLRNQLSDFSKKLVIVIAVLTASVFVIGYFLRGMDFKEVFSASVALAVSAIPEGLLIGLTVVLAIGMQRILKQKGLVRRLVSAETLGGVSTICVDKTGTLTEGKMKVTETHGDTQALFLQAAIANDLDDPLVIAAWEWAEDYLKKNLGEHKFANLSEEYKRYDSIPFSAKERMFVSLNRFGEDKNIVFVNGAPEYLLNRSNITQAKKTEILTQIEKFTSDGKRVVGYAKKEAASSKKNLSMDDARHLEWVGMLAFSDPVRVGVKEAFEKTAKAGVSTIVITGDYPETAIYVMHRAGIEVKDDEVITGQELSEMSASELARRLRQKSVKLFARTTPEQKMKIVDALKKNGEVVAMTGDGVNDAPALKRADIGIVVSGATDVAKESADMVLLDSNFSTIVAAIEEGRGIFENIRKIILYLMSDAFSEIVIVMGSILIGLPLPVTAVQILWINLVSDGLPHLALTVDPKRDGIMSSPPRDPGEPLVSGWMKALIVIISGFSGIASLLLFIFVLNSTSDYLTARSVAFVTLGVNSLIYVYSVRTLTYPFWTEGLLVNKWLTLSVGCGFLLQILPFLTRSTQNMFGIVGIGSHWWAIIILVSGAMFVMIELTKFAIRRYLIRL